MKDLSITAAKEIADKFEKDQVIILAWDRTSCETWVTTYGQTDTDSIQAANGGNMVKDFLELKREHDEIPERFKEWVIESVDRYYYLSGRNSKTYTETTFWYEKHTLERKETTRSIGINDGEEYTLPDWAKAITTRRKSLESNHVY